MINTPSVDWFALSTIFVLLGASFIALLSAVLVPRSKRRLTGTIIAELGFIGGLVTSIWLYVDSANGHRVVVDAFYRDRWMALGQIIVCAIGLVATLVGGEQIARGLGASAAKPSTPGQEGAPSARPGTDDHIAEFFALLLACAAGMAFFVGAANLMTMFLSLEWFSIALYIMCAIDYDIEGSLEAGLKYLIIGSFGSAALLFGSALVYGATKSIGFQEIAAAAGESNTLYVLGLAMIITGLAFKMSAAPFHQWTPDVYDGAPTPVTAWMSAATKVAAFMLAFRVLVTAFPSEEHLWTWAFVGICIASLVIGNFAALVQRNIKRMLAYSSISHAGFLLMALSTGTPLGARAMVYYLIPYSAMAFGSFAIVGARERELNAPATLDNFAGFGWERPFLGVSMWFFLFGFAGLPLTGGFTGKFYVFAAAYDHGWAWLVVIGVLATLVSLWYYLAVVRSMYMRSSDELQIPAVAGGSPAREPWLHAAVGICMVVAVGSLFAVQPLIDLCEHAASALPL
jgi:NADH-quinone oxidoreductase subunit N